MKNKNFKPLVALALIAVVGVIGTTFAYFTSTDTFENVFNTKPYAVTVVNTFNSPDNWTPGTETPLTVTAKNTGDVDVAVRISFEEAWEDALGNTLPLQVDGDNVSVINFVNNDKWFSDTINGKTYYFYNEILSKNETTETLVDTVTFNPGVEIGVNSNCTTNAGVTTCTTTTSGYAGGKYELIFTVETAQADQYQNIWGIDYDITQPRGN